MISNAPTHRRRLVIFLKEPRPGRAKTRLGAEIGMRDAAWWFRLQAQSLVRRLAHDPRWETWLAVSPDREGLESRIWPPRVRRFAQGPGDLGARMGGVFRRFPPGPVLIIGSDIPAIASADIAAGFSALGGADAVFGPADDGGYWLIGLARGRRPCPAGLFQAVRWSTEHALADTRATMPDARVALLRPLRDVDHAADLKGAASTSRSS